MIQPSTTATTMTIGIDLGDRKSHVCVLDADGAVARGEPHRDDTQGAAKPVRGLGFHAHRPGGGRALGVGVGGP